MSNGQTTNAAKPATASAETHNTTISLNSWGELNGLQKQVDCELEKTERVLSVLKDRLSQVPKPNQPANTKAQKQNSDSDAEVSEDEMTRAEMANYMAGMLEQWQKEDAELLKKRKAAAAQETECGVEEPEEEVIVLEEGDIMEDDDDDDYEDCEEDTDEGMINIEGHPTLVG